MNSFESIPTFALSFREQVRCRIHRIKGALRDRKRTLLRRLLDCLHLILACPVCVILDYLRGSAAAGCDLRG